MIQARKKPNNIIFIDPKGDFNNYQRLKKKIRYKVKNKRKGLKFIGQTSKLENLPKKLVKFLPKDFKYKGKNYIHYAAEKNDIDMLNRAIMGKHDLSRHDSFGRNAISYLFSDYYIYGDSKLLNIEIFKSILKENKNSWKRINTYHFFSYFAEKIAHVTKYKRKEMYNVEKYKHLISMYTECLKIIKELQLDFWLSHDEFKEIFFRSTLQGELIKEAISICSNQKQCLITLIEKTNTFSTPIPDDDSNEEVYWSEINNPWTAGHVQNPQSNYNIVFNHSMGNMGGMQHAMIMGRTGSGKSLSTQSILKALEINQYADPKILYEMWKNYILCNEQLNVLVMSDDLLSLLQKYNKILYTYIFNSKLKGELIDKPNKKEFKKLKI